MRRGLIFALAAVFSLAAALPAAFAQPDFYKPPIAYDDTPSQDVIEKLKQQLESSDEELFPPAAADGTAVPCAARPAKRLKRKAPPPQDPSPGATTAGAVTGQQAARRPIDNDDDTVALDAQETQRRKREARKKRKAEEKAARAVETQQQLRHALDTERAVSGRAYTLSMAIPGSVLDNAQTKELRTYVAGQVARAAVIFQVDEIVVFDDQLGIKASTGVPLPRAHDCHVFMARILQYLETPQYLRRALFPMHSDLSCAGLLNPLDCPHHLRAQEWSVYREGVVTDRPLKEKEGSHVYVGLQREVVVDKRLTPGVRVTVKIDEASREFKKKSE